MNNDAHKAGGLRWRSITMDDGATMIAISNEEGEGSATMVSGNMSPMDLLRLGEYLLRAASVANEAANAYVMSDCCEYPTNDDETEFCACCGGVYKESA